MQSTDTNSFIIYPTNYIHISTQFDPSTSTAMASPHGISLQVTIRIAPENVETFFKHFKPLYEAVVAEPELRFFEVYQSQEDPGTISWVEHWFVNHAFCKRNPKG